MDIDRHIDGKADGLSENSRSIALASEPTAIGDQFLVVGVAPIRRVDRLALRAAAPLGPSKPQKPMNIGSFDLAARSQLEMFG